MKAMKNIYRSIVAACVVLLSLGAGCASHDDNNLRLLYWNIQNGMWSGQGENYDTFVKWVEAQQPDICVWCEAQSNYRTASPEKFSDDSERYLPDHWGELAARYGHKYWYKGGHRDRFPQAITSKYPIENVERIVGERPDSVVAHGCGWATIEKNGHKINIVTLHTWPQAYAFEAEDEAASRAENGGDKYRRMEVEYVCNHTIGTVPGAADQLWMMMGDFNAVSRRDNATYGFADDDTRLLAHDYVLEHTPYVDVIAERYPGEFHSSIHGNGKRIDFVYCTRPLYDRVTDARIVVDEYTEPVRDTLDAKRFWHPSDHRPILIDFDMQ